MVRQKGDSVSYETLIANIDAKLAKGTRTVKKNRDHPEEQPLTATQEARLRHQKAILEARQKSGPQVLYERLGVPPEEAFLREVYKKRQGAS